MDNDTVIKVENLHKKFCRSLKRLALNRNGSGSMFYGSVDVAFDICDKFGIIKLLKSLAMTF